MDLEYGIENLQPLIASPWLENISSLLHAKCSTINNNNIISYVTTHGHLLFIWMTNQYYFIEILIEKMLLPLSWKIKNPRCMNRFNRTWNCKFRSIKMNIDLMKNTILTTDKPNQKIFPKKIQKEIIFFQLPLWMCLQERSLYNTIIHSLPRCLGS